MNEVSIIINGVRYDAKKTSSAEQRSPCGHCDVFDYCMFNGTGELCFSLGIGNKIFKKSDKKFVEHEMD